MEKENEELGLINELDSQQCSHEPLNLQGTKETKGILEDSSFKAEKPLETTDYETTMKDPADKLVDAKEPSFVPLVISSSGLFFAAGMKWMHDDPSLYKYLYYILGASLALLAYVCIVAWNWKPKQKKK